MIINKLILKNFKRFENETIDFPLGVIGLIGENGAGKSSIIEGIIFALYGVKAVPTDFVTTKGVNVKTEVTLYFTIEDKEYEVYRTIKGKTHNATTYLNSEPVSEGVAAVQDYMETLLGMGYIDFKNTIYAAQGDLKAILDASAADRKKWFMRLLGIDNIRDYVEKQTKDKIKEFKQDITLLDGILIGIDKDEIKERINQIEKDRSVEIDNLEIVYTEYNLAMNEDEILKSELSDIEFQKCTHEDKLKDRDNIVAEIRLLNVRIEDNDKLVESSKKLIDESLGYKEQYNRYIEISKTYSEAKGMQVELQRQKNALLQEILSLDKMNANFVYKEQDVIDLQKNEIVEYKEKLATIPRCQPEVISEYNFIQGTVKKLGESITSEDLEIDVKAEKELLNTEIERIKPLVEEYERLRLRVEKCEKIEDYNRQTEILKSLQTQVDYETEYQNLLKENNKYVELEHELDKYEDYKERYEEVQDMKKNKQLQIEDIDAQLVESVEEPLEMQELLPFFNKYAGRESALRAYEESIQNGEMLIQELEIVEESLTELNGMISEVPFSDTVYNKILERISHNEKEKIRTSVSKNALSQSISIFTQQLELEQQSLQKYNNTFDKRNTTEEELQIYIDTRSLINNFLEELLSIIKTSLIVEANTIIYSVTDGLYKGLHIDDNFGIHVENEDGLYPVAMLSGGEKDVVAVALRVATSKLIASMHNQQDPTVLFFDEIFGALDATRRDNLTNVMNLMKSKFPQLVMISHIEEQKDSFPHSITVVRDDEIYSKIITS